MLSRPALACDHGACDNVMHCHCSRCGGIFSWAPGKLTRPIADGPGLDGRYAMCTRMVQPSIDNKDAADDTDKDVHVTELFGRFHGHETFLLKYPTLVDVPSKVPWILHYTVRFTPDMSDADIQNIIIAVAMMSKKAVDTRRMRGVNNCVLMFVAIYPSWDDDKRELWQIPEAGALADRVLKLGWDGIWTLAWAWEAKTIYYLTGDSKRFTPECRQHLARE